MSALGDVLAPAITAVGAAGIAYLTARTARGTQKVINEGQVDTVTTEGRLAIEDKAYARAEGYLNNALADARKEADDLRRDLATERQERREEHDVLNGQMSALRTLHAREMADVRQQMHALQVRAERAEQTARALARRTNQPDPDL